MTTMNDQRGEQEEARKIAPEFVIAASIDRGARLLAKALREGPFVLPTVPLVPFLAAGDGITLKCPGEVTLYSKKDGEEQEDDWPGGMTAAQVQAAANTLAEANARQAVTDDLNRQIALVNCQNGCKKVVGPMTINIVVAGHIIKVFVRPVLPVTEYTAAATAEGTVTVKCER